MLIEQRGRIFKLKIPRSLKLIYVHGKGVGLFADKRLKKGGAVTRFRADIVPCSQASREAVRISERYCYDTRWLTAEAFINHSCNPNTRLDVAAKSYVAVKAIAKNEEITFNYLTTEWDARDEAFECRCGSRNCYGWIRGLKYLSRKAQGALRPQLLSFLVRTLDTFIHNRRKR